MEWDPYIIYTEDRCSTLTMNAEEIEAGARADLDRQSSHKIEEILWTNVVDSVAFDSPDHPNVGLADPQLTTDTIPVVGQIYTPNYPETFPLVKGFSDMVDALTVQLGGARGMIHVEKRLMPYISFYGLAVQNGLRLTTTLGDHVVVPGTGYTGSSPEGAASSEFHSWIYGTSMVEVLMSPIEVFGDLSQSINRSTNLVEYRAERMALAHWDRQAHIGISVCLEDPAGDCSDAGS